MVVGQEKVNATQPRGGGIVSVREFSDCAIVSRLFRPSPRG